MAGTVRMMFGTGRFGLVMEVPQGCKALRLGQVMTLDRALALGGPEDLSFRLQTNALDDREPGYFQYWPPADE